MSFCLQSRLSRVVSSVHSRCCSQATSRATLRSSSRSSRSSSCFSSTKSPPLPAVPCTILVHLPPAVLLHHHDFRSPLATSSSSSTNFGLGSLLCLSPNPVLLCLVIYVYFCGLSSLLVCLVRSQASAPILSSTSAATIFLLQTLFSPGLSSVTACSFKSPESLRSACERFGSTAPTMLKS